MKHIQKAEHDPRVNARYPVRLEYTGTLIVIMTMAAGQQGILSFLQVFPWLPAVLKVGILFLYWFLLALSLITGTVMLRKRNYDIPLITLSGAARRVAKGDFSVRIPPRRRDGKKDYIEVMFDDFNSMVQELGGIELLTSDFVTNVSHEIKTPLAVIQSYAAALQDERLPPAQRSEYSAAIIAASEKLNTLVSNVLKLSKLENQNILPEPQEFDLCAQLAECALDFADLWERKGIRFSAQMDERAVLCADKEMLAIVWNNLLANALKFTESGGTVTLTQVCNGDGITVTVADSGCGMDEATLRRVFDKFFQGDSSHAQEGNGLGLALALRAVRLLGGELSVQSSPGAGSAFTVNFKK